MMFRGSVFCENGLGSELRMVGCGGFIYVSSGDEHVLGRSRVIDMLYKYSIHYFILRIEFV
jgi:hypothetical protein